MNDLEYFVRCASGFESLLADELKEMKIKRIRPLKGGVAFFGDIEQAYRVCLWSRVASRVHLILARIEAADAEQLYTGMRSIDWERHLPVNSSLAINAHGVNEKLRNTQFTAVKAKDAICDRLRDLRGSRPDVCTYRPDVLVDVSLRGERATIALDLSGEPLHRRGYRKEGKQSIAPLKENLAAAVVLSGGWKKIAAQKGSFIDPLCGSGTLAIEAAMIAADEAPGILRDYWGFSGWALHNETMWDALIQEADDRFDQGLRNMPRIIGSDHDSDCIALAKDNAKRAGLSDFVEFYEMDVSCLGEKFDLQGPSGLIASNPPYGERLGSAAELPVLYEAFSAGVSALPDGWTLAVITPDDSIDTAFGARPVETKEFYNGRIETMLRKYRVDHDARWSVEVVVPSSGEVKEVLVSEQNSGQFAARLKKVAKERRKWAKKQGVSCYRVYDADLPDYAVAIDVYEGSGRSRGQSYLVISEYHAPKTIDPDRARRRYNDVLALAPVVLEVPREHTFSKVRRREKGGGQYRDERKESYIGYTQESGYTFEVDLNGYLDTGLFLDHRMTRQMVGALAKDKHFLNLFAYTGTATVHAAGAGALSTTTVDLSQTYLNWAKRNMKLNGFDSSCHRYERADVMVWLDAEKEKGATYDLVFVDPPTFSNSKAMGKQTWSVERDHVALLSKVSELLSDNGLALFSCNLRGFKPDIDSLKNKGIVLEDISAQTIPDDFKRNAKIHTCYFVRKVH